MKNRWKERYGERLVLMETFVQPPYNYSGTTYARTSISDVGQTPPMGCFDRLRGFKAIRSDSALE